ncbi:hypothetical protein ACFSO0_11115 [Brevibacillus sp. GCM10020057]|uniref:hypothetical protein n=1 Tax=Brevibacillus sp. GCM10020057 TaxID=3317327 RepID=UPI003629CFEF
MEKDWVEMPQTEIPDEVRQVEIPEIGETTPHPKPDSPLAAGRASGQAEGQAAESGRPIGFVASPKQE